MKYIIILSAMFLMSCGNQKEDSAASEVETIPAKSMTLWTNNTELFVEFPALVVGKKSRFAAHFTILDKHQPVREGTVTVSLIKEIKEFEIRYNLLPLLVYFHQRYNQKKRVITN